jgi:hypothetical protein
MTEPKSETEAARRTTTPHIEVELLPAGASDDATVMERITHLTNEVYAVAEDDLWTGGATRTTVGEVADMTRAGQIAVARLRNRIVGSVRVQRLDDGTIGYRVARTGTIDEAYPALAPLLATPCDFVIYRKDLSTAGED